MEHEAKHPSDVIGNWGPVQRLTFIVLCFANIIAPFSNTGTYLYTPKQNFACNYKDSDGNLISLNNTCRYRDNDGQEVKCTNFTYDHSFYQRTLVEEFDMVCDHAWYSSFTLSVHVVGYGISGVLVGYISDRFGRLFAAKSAMIIEIMAGLSQVISPNIYFLWLCRLFVGISSYGRFLTGYVLIMEWIGPKYRATCAMLYDIGYHGGWMILLLYYYNVPDYKVVQMTISAYEVLVLLVFILLIRESPRWLITHDRMEQAEKMLTTAAKPSLDKEEVRRRVKSVILQAREEHEKEKNVQNQSVMDVWRVPILLKLSLILYYTWFAHAFIGSASFFNTESLSGNFFANLAIIRGMDCLVFGLVVSVFNKLPRKKTLIWGMVVEAIALLALSAVSLKPDWKAYLMIPNLIHRASELVVFQMYYLYTAETFPTTMRQASMGTCSIFARTSSAFAPFVRDFTAMTSFAWTNGIFCLIIVVNLILVLFIPDTGKIEIADTIHQKEKEVLLTNTKARAERSGSIISHVSLRV